MPSDDVYGALLVDICAGKRATEIVDRNDGYVMAFDARYLIAPFREWDDPDERRAMRFVRGRVLDVGCGGGRVCLHLQERGLDVAASIRRKERPPAANGEACEMPGCFRSMRSTARSDHSTRWSSSVRTSGCSELALATPWLDWLQMSRPELVDLLDGTGWQLARTLGDGPSYVAIIDRAA
ncbi:hypothetical protein BH20ACT13_BH20ACT13_17540 [soil metagenome]